MHCRWFASASTPVARLTLCATRLSLRRPGRQPSGAQPSHLGAAKNKGGKLKELVRVREALKDYFVYDNEYKTTEEFWQQYFYEFNYAAAIQRGR